MKVRSGSYIEITGVKRGSGGLTMYGDSNSVENARRTIDESNAKRIADKWISEPARYMICRHDWTRVEEEDGTFYSSKDEVHVIEKYPAD